MAGPYPSAGDEWRMMSSQVWQAQSEQRAPGVQVAGLLLISESTRYLLKTGVVGSMLKFILLNPFIVRLQEETIWENLQGTYQSIFFSEWWAELGLTSGDQYKPSRCYCQPQYVSAWAKGYFHLLVVLIYKQLQYFSGSLIVCFFLQRTTRCAPQQQETATRGCHWPDRLSLLVSRRHSSSQMVCHQ